jgi:hypothetical protein
MVTLLNVGPSNLLVLGTESERCFFERVWCTVWMQVEEPEM